MTVANENLPAVDSVRLIEDVTTEDRHAGADETGAIIGVHEIDGKPESYEVEFDSPPRLMRVPARKVALIP